MTTWSFAGTTLTTYGKITVLDDYLDLPERRGNNQAVPYKHGTVFTEKFYDERTITMGIAMEAASGSALETNFDNLRARLSGRTQGSLIMTREDSTVRYAMASVNKSIQVTRKSATVALAVVEFELSYPFFRLSTAIADNTTTINSSPKAMTVTNPGTVEERDPTIVITGPFSSMTITNSTNGVALTYTGAIGAGATVTIGTLNGEYFATLSTGSANVIGNVTHSGSAALMVFDVGANTLAITSAGGDNTGTVRVNFNAPFI